MRVAIYIRVSTDEQAQEGYSIRAQRLQLVEYCKAHDYIVADVYIDEGFSAKNMLRPQLQRLLADAHNHLFDAILVYKLDRLTRSVKDLYSLLELLQAHMVGFISKQEKFDTTTAMGRAMIGMLGVFAQLEREQTSERVRMGQEQRVREGKKHGAFPFGYDKDGNLVPDEVDQLNIIRDLYMKEQLGFKSISVRLSTSGLTRRGTEWRTASVANALENSFYAGIIEYGGRRPDGKNPQRSREQLVDVIRADSPYAAVWTQEEFSDHIHLMRSRSNDSYSRRFDYWFTGLLRCSRCGSRMNGTLVLGRKRADGVAPRKQYYRCNRRVDNNTCNMPMFRQEHIEHMIMEYINQFRADKDVTIEEQKKIKIEEKSRDQLIAKLKRELVSIKDRVRKWQYMFIEELVTADDLRQRLDEEYAKETEITTKISGLIAEEKETPEIQHHLLQIYELWPNMDDLEKKESMSEMFREIKIITDITNPKGKINQFFDARIEVSYR